MNDASDNYTALAAKTRALAGAVAQLERDIRDGTVTLEDAAELVGLLALDLDRIADALDLGAEISSSLTQRAAYGSVAGGLDR